MRLLVMRHAKSDRSAVPGGDHERPLNARGRRAADAMGAWLTAAGEAPGLVITSSAVRARQTAERAAAAGAWDAPVVVEASFYGTTPDAVVARVAEEDDALDAVLVVGHEPVWSLLVGALCGGGRVRLPTAAVAITEPLVSRWRDVVPGCAELRALVPVKLVAPEG